LVRVGRPDAARLPAAARLDQLQVADLDEPLQRPDDGHAAEGLPVELGDRLADLGAAGVDDVDAPAVGHRGDGSSDQLLAPAEAPVDLRAAVQSVEPRTPVTARVGRFAVVKVSCGS
jgi:hypothetical protein